MVRVVRFPHHPKFPSNRTLSPRVPMSHHVQPQRVMAAGHIQPTLWTIALGRASLARDNDRLPLIRVTQDGDYHRRSMGSQTSQQSGRLSQAGYHVVQFYVVSILSQAQLVQHHP
jgi:hypothetical protein